MTVNKGVHASWAARAMTFLPAVVAVALLAGCESSSTSEGDQPATAVATSAPTTEEVTSSSSAAPSTTAAATTKAAPRTPKSWVMPNEVGQDLQDAQNAIQHLTAYSIFKTYSKDASGQDRFQVLDHDWKVCSQNVEPGQRIEAGDRIEFRVVKQDETCP